MYEYDVLIKNVTIKKDNNFHYIFHFSMLLLVKDIVRIKDNNLLIS